MNRLMILPAVAFALESFAGCSGFAEPWSAPISFRLSQPAAIREPVESRFKWREEAENCAHLRIAMTWRRTCSYSTNRGRMPG